MSTKQLFVANLTLSRYFDEHCLDIFCPSTGTNQKSTKKMKSKCDLFLRVSGLKPYEEVASKNILFSAANGGFRFSFCSVDLTFLTTLVVQA